MKFSLGFSLINSVSYKNDDSDITFINTHYLVKKLIEKADISDCLDGFLKSIDSDWEYISPIVFLNLEIEKANGLSLLDYHDVDLVKFIITELFFKTENFKKIDWVHEKIDSLDLSVKGLYLRYGNVELRVIESFFRYKDEGVIKNALEIVRSINDENFIYEIMSHGIDRWLSSGDLSFNIKALMTNAGFYFSENLETATSDILNWINCYINALLTSNAKLFPYPPCYPFFLNVQKGLSGINPSYAPSYLHFPDPKKFFSMLKGRKVLILSPFKDEINRMLSEHRLRNLYDEFVIEDIVFHVIEAPISTYPNRPNNGWSDTYNQLKQNISYAMASCKFDIFLASCGCYGLPIVSHVYHTYDCTSVYYGNFLNTLFGIRQNCSIDFEKGRIKDHLRISGDLSKFKNVSLIDGGRYV